MSSYSAIASLFKRQNTFDNNDNDNNNDNEIWDNNGGWWYSGTATAVKWIILAVILSLFLLFILGGYLHAQRRIKKGLPPLAYHRWLLSRRQRAAYDPRYATAAPQNNFSFYQAPANPYPYQGNAFHMDTYPAPPPAYDPSMAPPPKYQPPAGGSKVDPEQHAQTGTNAHVGGPSAAPTQ